MTPFMVYLIKVIACSGILYGYYYIALRNNKFHQWNRYYLLLSTLLSLALPLLRIRLPFMEEDSASTVYAYTSQLVILRETVLPTAKKMDIFDWSTLLYTLVLAFLLIRIAWSCWKIMSIVRNNPVQYVKPYWFVVSEKVMSPFSFFRYIFWNRETRLESPEGQQILQHELAHLTEKHSLDKLLLEVITAICWINPFFHLMKRELALIHEFIADKKASANGQVAAYARTILQMAMGNTQFTLTNNFFHPPIKRRIIMLTQSKQPRFSYLRRVMILPLGAVIFASLSFVVDKKDIAELKAALIPATKPATVTEVQAAPVLPAFSSTSMKKAEEPTPVTAGDKLEGVVSSKSGTPVKNATILVKGTQSGTISEANGSFSLDGLPDNATIVVSSIGFVTREIPVKKGVSNILIQLERDSREMGEIVIVGYGQQGDYAPDEQPQEPAKKKEVFTFVEQPPKYPGGTQELNKYMSRNIRYPHAATVANITGTVFVTFVVDEQGNITDVNTVGKPRGGGLEEEAMRVVKGMPKWEPGKQNGQTVSVQFNLPVKFQLQKDTKPKQQTTTTAAPKREANEVFTQVEKSPAYPGGETELHKYLSKNVRYPHDAVEKGKSGTVFVNFIVQKDGSLTDIKTMGAMKGYGLEEEAIRVVKSMDKWNPGQQNGKDVAVSFSLPIRFTLHD